MRFGWLQSIYRFVVSLFTSHSNELRNRKRRTLLVLDTNNGKSVINTYLFLGPKYQSSDKTDQITRLRKLIRNKKNHK